MRTVPISITGRTVQHDRDQLRAKSRDSESMREVVLAMMQMVVGMVLILVGILLILRAVG